MRRPETIEQYLRALDDALRASLSRRERILAELRSGRRRRVYRLTRRGRAALGHKKEGWKGFSSEMTAALEGTR